MGYTTATWLGFGEALAAVAGALVGLLFVAVSAKSEVLAASGSLSSRAAQTLVLFMTSVPVGVLLVAPRPAAALGWELLAVAVVSGAALLILDRRAGHGSDQRVARYIEKFSPNMITAVLVSVAYPGPVVRPSCLGRDRDQEFPVVDQRAVRRVVRGGGEGDEVVAEGDPAFVGKRFGCLERGPVIGQEEVGEELR